LTISGQIVDNSHGYNVTKLGPGKMILSHANTYRGITTVQNGVLTMQDPNALGNSPSFENSVIVKSNSTTQEFGALQLDNEDTTRPGFVVSNLQLTINGPGSGGVAPFDNFRGNNTWTDSVTLGDASLTSAAPNGISVDAFGGVNTN